MENRDQNDLTPAERAAFDRLPRRRMPSQLLEERTVRALKQRGLVRSVPTRVGLVRPWIAAAAVAAAVALFASGITVGQFLGARQTADALAAIYPDQTERAAALVQTTGSAYTAALGRLADATETADAAERQQAREVAQAALWAAASEVVRMAPDDPLAVEILKAFEQSRGSEGAAAGETVRNVLWF
jgi:hypothetical protein